MTFYACVSAVASRLCCRRARLTRYNYVIARKRVAWWQQDDATRRWRITPRPARPLTVDHTGTTVIFCSSGSCSSVSSGRGLVVVMVVVMVMVVVLVVVVVVVDSVVVKTFFRSRDQDRNLDTINSSALESQDHGLEITTVVSIKAFPFDGNCSTSRYAGATAGHVGFSKGHL